jgi:hypothetical protein
MKRFLFMAMLALTAIITNAQTWTGANVNVSKSLKLRGNLVTNFQNDTNFISDFKVPTSLAVKAFVNARIGTGSVSNGWGLTGNNVIGSEVIGTLNNAPFSFIVNNFNYGHFKEDSSQIWIGKNAGLLNNNIRQTIFLGDGTGSSSSGAYRSVGIGYGVMENSVNNKQSVAIGFLAGSLSDNSSSSYCIGLNAFYGSPRSPYTISIGQNAGAYSPDGSYNQNFGFNAGTGSSNSSHNFRGGQNAGLNSMGQLYNNMLGQNSMANTANSTMNNSFGINSLFNSSNVNWNNAIGAYAGENQSGTNFNNLIGYKSGKLVTNALGQNNTIIGTCVTMPPGSSNTFNLGNILYATGTQDNVGNPTYLPKSGGRIGIGTLNPNSTLDVNGDLKIITQEFADNAAALAANLQIGTIYRTGDFLKIVH